MRLSTIHRKQKMNHLALLAVCFLLLFSNSGFAETLDCYLGSFSPPYDGVQACIDCPPIMVNYNISVTEYLGNDRYVISASVSGRGPDGLAMDQTIIEITSKDYNNTVVARCAVNQNFSESSGDEQEPCYECSNTMCTEIVVSGNVATFEVSAGHYQDVPGSPNCNCNYNDITIPLTGWDPPVLEPPDATDIDPHTRCAVGDPIDVSNGNMFQNKTDLVMDNEHSLPIIFKRYYNSFGDGVLRSLGYKWRHNYEYYISEDVTSGNITLFEGTGREVYFEKYGECLSISESFPALLINNLKFNIYRFMI